LSWSTAKIVLRCTASKTSELPTQSTISLLQITSASLRTEFSHAEDRGSTFLRNAGKIMLSCVVLEPQTPSFEGSFK